MRHISAYEGNNVINAWLSINIPTFVSSSMFWRHLNKSTVNSRLRRRALPFTRETSRSETAACKHTSLRCSYIRYNLHTNLPCNLSPTWRQQVKNNWHEFVFMLRHNQTKPRQLLTKILSCIIRYLFFSNRNTIRYFCICFFTMMNPC